MIKAQSQDVPDEVLAFLRSDDPERDSDEFWAMLKEWYQDRETNQWHARWRRFVFPYASFVGATFTGDADFARATFTGHARFADTTFTGDAGFDGATFTGGVDFARATFTGDARFARATFTVYARFADAIFTGYAGFAPATFTGDATFVRATFTEDADFAGATFTRIVTFVDATFTGGADFASATFTWDAGFAGVTFTGDATFTDATFTGDATFTDAIFVGIATFVGSTFTGDAHINRTNFNQKVSFASLQLSDSCRFSFVDCALAKVELRSLDLRSIGSGAIRLAGADDIERLALRDVQWPEKANRPRTADEADLDSDALGSWEKPSTSEVERVYRGLRKNLEDRGDRVGAHGWYFSEMEVGRIHAKPFSLKRVARGFYKATSNYGLSAARPAFWLCAAVAIALALFSLGAGWCPARPAADPTVSVCVGLEDRLQVALLAVFLQAPPSGVVLSGVLGQIVWLILRVTGAAMLISIGIAFRNQVAR